VRYYTPVNEIYVTALFSGAFGWWNERLVSDLGFVTNVKHCVPRLDLGMRAILDLRPTRSSCSARAPSTSTPAARHRPAGPLHERAAVPVARPAVRPRRDATIYRYCSSSGMTPEEYAWFMGNRDLRSHCIMGTDYYITNEHVLRPRRRAAAGGDVYGYYVITAQYYDRYRLPVMHTETNRAGKHASSGSGRSG
jgi:hypothetical protein